MLLIFFYVFFYQVLYKCGYLEMPDVGISMVSSLRYPDVTIDSRNVPYCSQGDSCTGKAEEKCPCRRFRPEELRQNQDTINLVTSVAYIDNSGDVARVEYVPDVENYELLLEPTVYQRHHMPGMANEVVQGYQIQGRTLCGVTWRSAQSHSSPALQGEVEGERWRLGSSRCQYCQHCFLQAMFRYCYV